MGRNPRGVQWISTTGRMFCLVHELLSGASLCCVGKQKRKEAVLGSCPGADVVAEPSGLWGASEDMGGHGGGMEAGRGRLKR